MDEQTLFYLVFLSQVVLVSFLLPRWLRLRMEKVIDRYPPSEYPRLYPRPVDFYQRRLRRYQFLNYAVAGLGLALLAIGLVFPSGEMLGWDTTSVLTLYMALQWTPLLVTGCAGFVYFSPRKKPDTRPTRTARLQPRRLFDFVSPRLVASAVVVYIGFVLLVFYVAQFDFPWFGGYWNIIGVTALNGLFAAGIYQSVAGRRRDPYQAHEDRLAQIELTVKLMVFSSIAGTVFIALTIVLRLFELGDFVPAALSLYAQLVAVLAFRSFRTRDVDFEVYREEPVVA